MKDFFKNIRYFSSYLLALFFCFLIRISPRCFIRFYASLAARCVCLMPSALKICCANIKVAFPDWDASKVRSTAQKSIRGVLLNFLEFIWMSDVPRRIERVCNVTEETAQLINKYKQNDTRIIFVTPHLGSWEASGLMAPYFLGVEMAAIAKPSRNKYLNKLISQRREKAPGLKIIFSKGAMRAAIKALRQGMSIGTLIDQNTRGRDGGEFVDFFGLKASSSTAPALMVRYCAANDMPAVILYAACVRENNRITSYVRELSMPFEKFESDNAVIQDLMNTSEEFIRRYPEQYVWLYRRFRYIPLDADQELAERYPYYAKRVKPSFYNWRIKWKECQDHENHVDN